MRLAVAIATLLVASTAHADRDPDFEAGLSAVPIEGSQVLPGPSYTRPQLVYKDTKTKATVGTAAAIGGGLSLVAGWVVYVASQNYRLQVRSELTTDVISSWETQRHWALTLTGFGAANLIASEMLLLDGDKPPTFSWVGSAAGVGVAAVGLGFAIGGTHCSPLAYAPGSQVPLSCLSGTSDAIFGWQLLLTSAPLITLPISYWLRGLFAEEVSLTLDGTGARLTGRF